MPFRTTDIVECGDHHWSKAVSQSLIETEDQLASHCRGPGALCAFAYFLNAADLHYENVLYGKTAYLIDVETFFVPRHIDKSVSRAETISDNLFETYLVPDWKVGHFGTGWDWSPLGARGRIEIDAVVLKEADTARPDFILASQEHIIDRLQLSDQAFGKLACDNFIAGFGWCYQCICGIRDQVLALLHTIPDPPCRIVLRPTSYYERIMVQSFHPSVLFGVTRREDFLRWRLKEMSLSNREFSGSIVDFEVSCLSALSFPRFCSDWNSTDLRFDGRIERKWFPRSAFTEIRERLLGASGDDPTLLEKEIRESFERRFATAKA